MSLLLPAYIQRDPDYYITTFGEYASGSQPSGWTQRYGTNGTQLIGTSSGSFSGQSLQFTKANTTRQLLTWDKIPAAANMNILMRMRPMTASPGVATFWVRAATRASGAASTENCYLASMYYHTSSSTLWRPSMHKLVSGTSTQLGTNPNGQSPSWAYGTWFWLRFEVTGTTIRERMWADGSSEPGTWINSVTDSSLSSGGWTGLFSDNATTNAEVDFFGAALNGKTVPTNLR